MGTTILPTTAMTLAPMAVDLLQIRVIGMMLRALHNRRILSLLRKLPREMVFPLA